jgi:hypothetical protein
MLAVLFTERDFMNTLIVNLLDKMQTGELQSFKNMTVVPFFYKNGNKLEYVTLDEALNKNFIEIKEISEGGSVPELFVENKSDVRVLLLDGEELIGAKQNRILNATILLDIHSKTTIPVSCVEQNRWSYKEKHFSSSEYSMPNSSRSMKMSSVKNSLERGDNFLADQRQVWNEVERFASEAKVNSATNAMHDVFENKKNEIDNYMNHFRKLEGQNGFIVFINDKPAGMEYISNETAFASLFNKILKGYAMDALIDNRAPNKADFAVMLNDFTGKIKKSEDKEFKSIGLGFDHRIETADITASILIAEEEIVHFSALGRAKQSNLYKTRDFIRR